MRNQVRDFLSPLAPPIFTEDEDKTRKALYAHVMALVFLGLVIGFELYTIISGQHRAIFSITDLLLTLIAGACVAGLVLLRRGYVRFTSIMFVTLIWIAANGMAINFGVKDATYIANFAIVLMAGLLLSWPAALAFTGLSIAAGVGLAWAENTGRITVLTYSITSFVWTVAIVFGLNAGLIGVLISGLERALRKSRSSVEELASANAILNFTQAELQNRSTELLEANQQLEQRSQTLNGIAQIARTTTAIHNLDQLLPSITSVISQQLGYYHVGLFLLDEQKQYAILRSANTVEGQRMLNRGYRVAVGSISPVGYIAQTGKPRITRRKNEDSTFLSNIDFPETRSQLVMPLGSVDDVIGVLDIQSREANAFSEADMATLSIMTDQIAIAIKNALLYEQSQVALREAYIASRQASSQAWSEYGKIIQTKGYRYDGIKSEPLREGKQSKRDNDALSIPVQLRDQTIGCLKLKSSDPSHEWTEDELTMIKATADRVALALEGARLLDEAQKRAKREAFLSDVTAKLGTSFQLDSILRDTVEELGQTLKNSTVTFQLVNPTESNSTREESMSARGNGVKGHE